MATITNNLLLQQAWQQATATLQTLAGQPGFKSLLRSAFGNKFTEQNFQRLARQLQLGDFSGLPRIEILTNGELGNAAGGYAIAQNRIYINGDFLTRNADNVTAIADVLLEEIGHSFDRRLNGQLDSAGDEGEIFRLLARGVKLSAAQLQAIKAEDDRATVIIRGQLVSIEQIDLTNGNDNYRGTAGNDAVYGLLGDDTMYGENGSDFLSGNSGNDVLIGDSGPRLGDPGHDTLYGGDGIDYLYGNGGNDYLYGGDGIDYLYGDDGNDIIAGENGNDFLYGNSGDDLLAGSDGNDSLFGSDGNDTFYGGNGNDSLFGSDGNDTFYGESGIDDLRGELGNDSLDAGAGDDALNGGRGDDTLFGDEGNDSLFGEVGNDILYGDLGNDTLDGGAGENQLYGGAGSDLYCVRDGSDMVFENSLLASSIDIVNASISYTLAANLEHLTLTNLAPDALTGTGNDRNNTLTGNSYANTLTGHGGNDSLNGREGADVMTGGSGDDVYFIDNAGDQTIETSTIFTEIDTVNTSVSYTLAVNLEHLTLTNLAPSALIGTGNDRRNILTGNSYANTLTGYGGNDSLNGKEGADVMTGGSGDDVYFVDNAGDQVFETSTIATEIDLVYSYINYTLAANIERLYTVTAVSGTGNALNNTIASLTGSNVNNILSGGSGNDTIDGGLGVDTLTGGVGVDRFILHKASGTDTITDFTAGETLQISGLEFGGNIFGGALAANRFVAGAGLTTANNATQRFIFDTTTRSLYFDIDGNGATAAAQIAVLQGTAPLTAASFTVVS
jgi:serralysin